MTWQRFTERARRVVFFAQEVAAERGEGEVSPLHLAAGLLREPDTIAAGMLSRIGTDRLLLLEDCCARLPLPVERPWHAEMCLTSAAAHILLAACGGSGFIGTEHLLLALAPTLALSEADLRAVMPAEQPAEQPAEVPALVLRSEERAEAEAERRKRRRGRTRRQVPAAQPALAEELAS